MPKVVSGGFCSQCQKRLDANLRFPYKGKLYCYDCYTKLQQTLVEKEDKIQKIYDLIKEIFGVSEVEVEAVSAIENFVNKEYKKPTGIYLTLYYYYKIMLNKPTDQKYIGWVIRTYYDAAKKFYAEQQKIREINATVSADVAPVHITLDPDKLHKEKEKRFSYNMEDL